MSEKVPEIAKPQFIEIKLNKEIRMVRKGDKLVQDKDPEGNPNWLRHDAFGLLRLLNHYDTRKHQLRDWTYWPKIIRKLEKCTLEDTDSLKLSVGESGFLRSYLQELPKQEAEATQLGAIEVETMNAILEQLPE